MWAFDLAFKIALATGAASGSAGHANKKVTS
jgi:hypothetical protein